MTRAVFSLCCPRCGFIAALPDDGSPLGIRPADEAGSITVQDGTGTIVLGCCHCLAKSVIGYCHGEGYSGWK